MATTTRKGLARVDEDGRHPFPLCFFGHQHNWSEFVYIEGHFACGTCGVEDDETWWDDTDRIYIGPSEPGFVDVTVGGWLLRRSH